MPRSFVQIDFLGAKIQSREGNSPDRTLRAQVIPQSDETLKAAFSSVSRGTFCQSGKVFGDKTWRYHNGRGYWQELIESIVWAHNKLKVAPATQPRALSIVQGRAVGVTHYLLGGIATTWAFFLARIIAVG
ncbi:photosystem I P700 apoprotein A1 [Tanacetum coccineum]